MGLENSLNFSQLFKLLIKNINMQKPFQLQGGEKVVKDIKPLPVLKWYFFW